MKKFAASSFIALVLAFASGAHAASVTGPADPTPQFPTPNDPGPKTDRRGPIDPFPPPTLSVLLVHMS